ncbi:MAG TPA: efflux RND transporter permease subunit [Paenibacillus sp.]|uniref:efflux RND transporter permease subunit n=1 Tax=Paenibacillus sp. TaxID=58172 RepID=UPI002BA21556|nr:efflux RND transporter permease subunit [Paenibacillus sp.]HUC91394.1 efflux RND transporter permease subunit [Paenibacillus sp.]
MRSIIGFSLKNKFALWMITLIAVVAGLYSGLSMKQESLPNLSFPFLNVTTVYPGASPDGVVKQVTEPLEQRLTSLSSIKNVTSSSMENVSNIMIEFDFGQDMDKAVAEIREAVANVKLPEGAQAPDISRFSFNSFPVISLSVSDSNNQGLEELTRIVTDDIAPALQGIDGVASVQIAGQYVQEVRLAFDDVKMAELGLNRETVKGVVQGSAVKIPLGLFEIDRSEKAVVVDGRITTLDDLKNVEIPVIPIAGGTVGTSIPGTGSAGVPNGGAGGSGAVSAGGAGEEPLAAPGGNSTAAAGIPTVKLSDIATIELAGQAESISRTNGRESIGIQIVKANDANTVDVVNAVKNEIGIFEKKYDGLKLDVMLDQGKPIEKSVQTMLEKAWFGALFAVIVILLFLRNVRTTMISIVSIPLSLIIAVLLLREFNITLNIMTLGAMTVAIGRVVDDSIVVIENIYRRMSLKGEKLKGKELFVEATREMFMPIMSSTVVTVAVFLPLGLVTGMVGQLFLPFALTIVFSLFASLLVAVTVVPMLGHMLFRNGIKESKKHDHEEKPGALAGGYRKALSWTLNHKAVTFGLAVILLLGSFALVPLIGSSFLPEEEQKYAMITYTSAPGDRIEDVEQQALQAEKAILDANDPELLNLQYSVGGSNPLQPGPSRSGLFFLQYKDETENFSQKKEQLLAKLRQAAPEGEWAEMDMGAGGIGGSRFSLSVYGESLEDIKPVVDEIAGLMSSNDSFEKVDTSLSKTYGQFTIAADQAKLSRYGLTAGQIAMKLSPVRTRPVLTQVKVEDKTYDVYVEVNKAEYKTVEDIRNETIASPTGVEVKIGDVAAIEEGTSPNSISREGGRMVVTVSGDITEKDVAKISADFLDRLGKLEKPASVEIKAGGVTEQINDTFTQLGLAMAAAVAIVYLVLVLTFGGALAPFAIMFSLPFAVIGGLVALWVAGETLSVSALMGALMLIGIVVTNAIVLIDRVIHMEREGLSTREALLEAAGTRLRPILMTALATIGALLPLAFGLEGSGIISRGLGVTVIGGLISSTLLTLIIVPIVYETLMKLRRKSKNAEA